MVIFRNTLFVLSGLAFLTALVVTLSTLGEVGVGDPMGPLVFFLVAAVYVLPAVLIGVVALIIALILQVRLKQIRGAGASSLSDPDQRPEPVPSTWYFIWTWVARLGVAYAVISLVFEVISAASVWIRISQRIPETPVSGFLVSALVSSVGAAVPGLLICLVAMLVRGKN